MAIRPADTFADIPEVAGRRARWWAAAKDFVRKRPLGAIGAAIVLLNIIVALGANVFAAYDPLATDYGAMLARPSMAHWLGTDAFGRDVLSRIIFGSRTAMIVGFACACFGATVGAVIGVASAYFGGKVDLLIQRVMDIFLSFPLIILALAVVSILGTGVTNVILAITVPMIPRASLVARSSALAIREMPYVDAARAAGFRHRRIILRHMLPNGRRGADAGVGTDAPRRCRAVRRAGALDGDLPRPRHQPGRVRFQPVRRFAARCARSTPAHAVAASVHGSDRRLLDRCPGTQVKLSLV